MRASSSSIRAKRLFDVVASALGLVVLSPVIAVVGVLIWRCKDGPVILRQTRIGMNEKPFTCLKFRTMAMHTPVAATHEVSDSFVTPIGRKLRRFKIDEIPQLLNVLRGEMSLVGPRPCLPVQTELIEARRARDVFDIQPGITGLAQVRNIDMSTPVLLSRIDALYLKRHSMALDITLIVHTVVGRTVFTNRYR